MPDNAYIPTLFNAGSASFVPLDVIQANINYSFLYGNYLQHYYASFSDPKNQNKTYDRATIYPRLI